MVLKKETNPSQLYREPPHIWIVYEVKRKNHERILSATIHFKAAILLHKVKVWSRHGTEMNTGLEHNNVPSPTI